MAPQTDFLASRPSKRAAVVWAIAIFIAALFLRLGGIGWGLPYEDRHQSLHPDELLIKQYADLTPYFTPGFYNYGTLYLTALKISADMGRTYGWVREGSDVPQWETDRDIHLSGRLISAATGAGTASLIFLALINLTGLLGAFLGALAMLIAPGHVVHSRFQTTDVFAAFFISLAIYFLVLTITAPPEKRLKWALFCGGAIGLATGTKYTGFLLLFGLFAALFFAERERWLKLSLYSSAAFAAVFVIATPGVFLEPGAFWAGFSYELKHSAEGHGIVFANTPSGFALHFINLAHAFGLLPLLFGIAGLGYFAFKGEKWALALAVFFLLYYFVIGRAEVKFLRYVFPLLPVLAIAIGKLAGDFHIRGNYGKAVPAVILLVLGYSAVAQQGAMQLTSLMRLNDPRDQAAQWLKSLPGQPTIGFVSDPWFYSPPLFPDTGLLGAERRLSAMSENPNLIRYVPQSGQRIDWDPRLISEAMPEYIVFSSFEFMDSDRINEPHFLEFWKQMPDVYQLVAIFWDSQPVIYQQGEFVKIDDVRRIIYGRFPLIHDLMYVRPTICVFKRI